MSPIFRPAERPSITQWLGAMWLLLVFLSGGACRSTASISDTNFIVVGSSGFEVLTFFPHPELPDSTILRLCARGTIIASRHDIDQRCPEDLAQDNQVIMSTNELADELLRFYYSPTFRQVVSSIRDSKTLATTSTKLEDIRRLLRDAEDDYFRLTAFKNTFPNAVTPEDEQRLAMISANLSRFRDQVAEYEGIVNSVRAFEKLVRDFVHTKVSDPKNVTYLSIPATATVQLEDNELLARLLVGLFREKQTPKKFKVLGGDGVLTDVLYACLLRDGTLECARLNNGKELLREQGVRDFWMSSDTVCYSETSSRTTCRDLAKEYGDEASNPVQAELLAATPSAVSFEKIVLHCNGVTHCGLAADGRVHCWGSSSRHADEVRKFQNLFDQLPAPMIDIACGLRSVCGISQQGQSWQRTCAGDSGVKSDIKYDLPIRLSSGRSQMMCTTPIHANEAAETHREQFNCLDERLQSIEPSQSRAKLYTHISTGYSGIVRIDSRGILDIDTITFKHRTSVGTVQELSYDYRIACTSKIDSGTCLLLSYSSNTRYSTSNFRFPTSWNGAVQLLDLRSSR